jgi:hypothetical protein
MHQKINQNDIKELILSETLKIIKKEKLPIKKGRNFALIGKKTEFDSVALITLILSIEETLFKKYKKKIVISDNKILNDLNIIKDTNSLSIHIFKKINAS